MFRFTPIMLEWNNENGFIFEFFQIDNEQKNFYSGLFGLNIAPNFLYIDIFYFNIKVFERNVENLSE